MKLHITIDKTEIIATLKDHPTSTDFIAMLPLSLILEDFGGKEKINDLPKKLSITGAPVGSKPSKGDIAYYAPWGNLAIFYQDAPYVNGLIILGKIDANAELIKAARSIIITL
jgi:hypothetical protein